MLSEAEADALDRLSVSAVMSITAVMGLASVPAAVDAIEQAMPEGYSPKFGFGSSLSEKYGQALGLKLPIPQFQATDTEHDKWIVETATLIACGLLGSAYELLKIEHRDENDPLWEFFRHTRNAAFHSNQFHFRGGEPTRPAE